MNVMRSVSIVIPCYNAGEYLQDAVSSALAQTYPCVDIVIVDDGSDDPHTVQLLKAADWPRTTVLWQSNSGPSAARNLGIRTAAGEYILTLDADDTIEPGYVARAVDILSAHPDVGVVYCRAMKFGSECGEWELPRYKEEELAIDNVVFVSGLFRRSDWKKVGGFDEGLKYGMEDYDFWLKILGSGLEIVQLEEFFFNYRVQQSSRTSRFHQSDDNVVATYATIFRNNVGFYLRHAETIFHHRLALYRQLRDIRDRYKFLEETVQSLREFEVEVLKWRSRYQLIDRLIDPVARLSRPLRRRARRIVDMLAVLLGSKS